MPTFEAWDVVKVPFPYTDRTTRQRRPALVVSVGGSLLWVLMITSAENRAWPGDVVISDLPTAGLRVGSAVRTAKIATIEAAYAEPLGRLPEADRSAVARLVREALQGVLPAR
jgi:mRNA interferase MazF